ncbi:DUF6443 domain-containing protein [Chryseobacterium taihuense]|nr:DUF6443 domain-containing protein [Chryseobacterium taihuense]
MKKKLSILLIFSFYCFHAQTTLPASENYIYSKTCLSGDCTKKAESVQYFDGLGRLKQSVSVKSSPSGKDIVIPVEYDSYGRQIKSYLPIPQPSTQNGGIHSDPLSAATATYGNEKIYSEKIPEASPLGRVIQQKSQGNEWSSHPAYMSYKTNADQEVNKYSVSTTWTAGRTNSVLSYDGKYPEGQLYKTQVTDEDGNISTEFKNKKGQVILTRKTDGSQNLDTYFVYNEYGQKAFVITPSASFSNAIDDNILDNLCYQYRYDGWNRLVEKKLPGKGWEYMIYDKADRLVAAKDSQNPWIFTKYDQLGRVTYTGTADLGSRVDAQAALNNLSGTAAANNESKSSSSFSHSGIQIYYSNSAYPTNITSILSVNYYDVYPADAPAIPTQILGQNVLSQDAQNSSISTKSLPTASYVKNIENDSWTKNYIWYDHKGRTVGTHSINHLGGYTQTESLLDFAGVPQQSIVRHKRLNTDTEKVITQTFTYDHQNRVLIHKHKVGNNSEEILAQNTYNELSQVVTKKVGGTALSSPLQTVDYHYNIRGWIQGVNNPENLGNDLFAYTLKYHNPDNTIARYNGNIAEIDWKKNNFYAEPVLRRFSFTYDNANRLSQAAFSEPNSAVPHNGLYNETAAYDANGNITELLRNAPAMNGIGANLIDNLAYHYQGNKLTNVDDKSGNSTGYEGGNNTIDYDDNGNMVTMPDKMIDQIEYNILNLPVNIKIKENRKKVSYLYRADGTKLRKNFMAVGDNGQIYASSTQYLDGFQYASSNGDELWALFQEAGGGAYEPEAFEEFLNSYDYENVLKFVPTAEGFYDFENNQYIYQYKDHLGNARLSYKKEGDKLSVTDSNDYYAFGMSFVRNKEEEARFGTGSYVNFKYNGKELQETGMYDYGWRHYMADLGRWNGIDQLAEMYQSTSTYAYVANNPVMRFDVDGRWFNEDGTIDTSGRTPNFTTGKQYRDSFLGANRNDGSTGGMSQELIDRMLALGGDWYNTEYGFESSDHIALGYNGSYLSLNTLIDGFIDIPEVVLNGDSSSWGSQMWNHFNSFTNSVNSYAKGINNYPMIDFPSFLEKHYNGGLGYTEVAVKAYQRIPNDVKRHYAYKLSKVTPWKSGKIYQNSKAFMNKAGRLAGKFGKASTALSVVAIGMDIADDGHIKTSSLLNGGLLAAGLFIPGAAPFILAYGILDYTFDIGDKIDAQFGGINTHIYD